MDKHNIQAMSLNYLSDLCDKLALHWPDNKVMHIVCHGHSVPAGYFTTPWVNSFDAYPHLLHRLLKERFPFAVINVIVTAIGGENSLQGKARFRNDVLCHKPQVVTIDYGLNDRQIGLKEAEASWRFMIETAMKKDIKVLLLTPSWEITYFHKDAAWQDLILHCTQIRNLAAEYGVGLCDSFKQFEDYVEKGGAPQDLLSHINHPSRKGHELIANVLGRWFPAR
jgi:lysophospholipase L1-like esterase